MKLIVSLWILLGIAMLALPVSIYVQAKEEPKVYYEVLCEYETTDGVCDSDKQDFTLFGSAYTHDNITWSGNPLVGEMLTLWGTVSNVENGGESAFADIRFVVDNTISYPVLGYASKGSAPNSPCQISTRSENVGYVAVMLHEVGHCLGLGHSSFSAAVMAPYCCNPPFHADDIAGIVSLYDNDAPSSTPTLTPTPTRVPPTFTPVPPTATPTPVPPRYRYYLPGISRD